MNKLGKAEPWLFYIILAILLMPVWAVDFFVTSDGPCHLYNSKILADWSDDIKRTFYDPFYFINRNVDPNRLYNVITIPLLSVFGPQLSEKIFFTVYALGFGLGFRFLLGQINPASKFLGSVALLFCFHKLLMTGFFNNSLSFMVWLWIAGWWWKKRNDFGLGILIINAGLFLLLYSSHPIGLTFCMMMIPCMMAGLFYYETQHLGFKESRDLLLKRIQCFIMSSLPAMAMFAEYVYRSDLTSAKVAHSVKAAFQYIVELNALILMDSVETFLVRLTAILCGLILVGALYLRIRKKGLVPADGTLLFLAMVLFFVIAPPNSIGGGLDISFRISIVPFIALLCWSATADFPMWAKLSAQGAALMLAAGFVSTRLPIHQEASEYATEIYSTHRLINDTSTVLVLNYDWEGKNPEGDTIADMIGLFTHVDCYLGAGDKALVISDNYESHFPYFPLQAKWNTDMYGQTDKELINFDHRPPRADILSYKRRTGQQIDYVLMLSYSEQFGVHPYTKEIFAQLDEAFKKVYTSEPGRVMLYERSVYN